MSTDQTVGDIIEAAVEREIEAHEFYKAVSEKMSDVSAKEIFSQLANEELDHRDFLRNCLHDGMLLKKVPLPADYKVAEASEEPALSVEMKPADAIALAMKKEQAAYEFYSALSAAATDANYKETFEGLARMEQSHKTRLEDLFVNIGYPEVF